MSAKPQGLPRVRLQRGELAINAAKVGKLTVRDLAAFAEMQGLELRVKFVRPAGRNKHDARIKQMIAPLAGALEFRP